MTLVKKALNLKTVLFYLVTAVIVFVVAKNAWADENDLLNILEQAETQKAAMPTVQEHLKLKELRAIIGSDSGDTNIFLQKLFASDYQGALLNFKDAMTNTKFAGTNGAKALESFLFWQNGLRLEALERLTTIEDLKTIPPLVLDFWRPLVKPNGKEWTIVKVKVSDSWGAFFGSPSQKDQAKMWKESTELALNDEIDKAAKVLSVLAKEHDPFVEKDLINLTAARLLYQRGYLDAAIRYDNMISRSSDYWFTAQEEAAWAQIRKGAAGPALAITNSLMHDKLSRDVSAETIFLHSLVNLKICNYPEVAKALTAFNTRFRPRVIELQKVIDGGEEAKAASNAALALAENKELTPVRIGRNSAILPRDTGLDRQLKMDGVLHGVLKAQAEAAGKLYTASLGSGSQVGFQAEYETLKRTLESRQQTAAAAFDARLRELAQTEVKDIGYLLQKMHIVEAEVIQQTGLAKRIAADTAEKPKSVAKVKFDKIKKDQIRFSGDQEIWFDELNHYKVQVSKSCRGKTL
ncbi:MAG: hypothetical protein AABZ31_12715 [Bdellovibrionota bacterium]